MQGIEKMSDGHALAAILLASAALMVILPRSSSLLAMLAFAILWGYRLKAAKGRRALALTIAGVAVSALLITFAIHATPLTDLDKRFSTQYDEIKHKGIAEEQQPSFMVGLHILANNILVIGKIVLLTAILGTSGIFMSLYTLTGLSTLTSAWMKSAAIQGIPQLHLAGFLAIRYLPHTIIEVSGFLFAGRATVVMLLEGFTDESLKKSLRLFAIALALIIIGSIVETFMPLIANKLWSQDFAFIAPEASADLLSPT